MCFLSYSKKKNIVQPVVSQNEPHASPSRVKDYGHLTHWGQATHICVTSGGHHSFRQWFVTRSVPSHYLNQRGIVVNRPIRNNIPWKFNWNLNIVSQENEIQNVVCKKMAAILSRHQSCNIFNRGTKINSTWRIESLFEAAWYNAEKYVLVDLSSPNHQLLWCCLRNNGKLLFYMWLNLIQNAQFETVDTI